ncbi:MAG: transglutaminase-like domain-containing protein [Candidatus Eremiobacterota bacterium]
MNSLPFSGILLFIFSLIAFVLTTGTDRELIGFFGFLALMSLFIKFRFALSRKKQYITYIMLLVPVLLNYFLRPVTNLGAAQYSLLQIPAYYVMLLSLFIIYRVKTMRDLMAFYFASTFIFIVAGFSTGTSYFNYFMVVYLILTVFYLRALIQYTYSSLSLSRKHLLPLSVVIIITCSVFFGANTFVEWLEPKMNEMFIPAMNSALDYGGFLNETSLDVTGNMKLSPRIIMRVFTSSFVGRVRCKAYTDYLNGKWKTAPQKTPLKPVSDSKSSLSHISTDYREIFSPDYPLPAGHKDAELRIKLVSGANTIFYVPPSGFAIMSDIPQVSMDQYGIFYPESTEVNMGYSVAYIPDLDYLLSPEIKDLTSSLNVPDYLSGEIFKLSRKLTEGKGDIMSQCLSVESYFHREFEYSLEFKPSRKGDPVEEFLLNKKAAHCEYFATSMVLLLRSAGIPARYVTGYLVHEYNRHTAYYIVRDRDAHAWVEAFVDGHWVTFDPTPAGGLFNELLGNSEPDLLRQFFDLLLVKWDELKGFLSKGDISGLFKWVLKGITSYAHYLAPFMVIVLTVLILVYLKRFKKFTFSGRTAKSKISESEESSIVRRFGEIIMGFDKIFTEKNIKRKGNLTLYEYIDYLKENNFPPEELDISRDFIKEYCILRYGHDEISEGDFLSLEKKLESLKTIIDNNNE